MATTTSIRANKTASLDKEATSISSRTGFRWFIRKLMQKRSAQFGGAVLLLLLICAVIGPYIVPYDPFDVQTDIRLMPPSFAHPFGTDELGRDLLSRIIYGARYTVLIGLVTVMISAGCGIFLGLWASYWGGWSDMLLMRMMDVMLSFPYILLTLAVVAALGPSLVNAMIAIGIAGIPGYARLTRSSVLSVKEETYVDAMRTLGASNWHIMSKTIFPNIISPVVIFITLTMPLAVLAAASLSFLGLGAQPPLPEWGAMMVNARSFIATAPWVIAAPGLAIFVTILGLNLFGNALRDVLDPRETS